MSVPGIGPIICSAMVATIGNGDAFSPKTVEEVLQQVEHEAGIEGRKAFKGFLKKMHKIKEEQGG